MTLEESRPIATPITTAEDLPARYPKGACVYFPRLDWQYIQQIGEALRGHVFLGPGMLRNAENARQRLIAAGLIRDATKGETS